MSLLKFERRGTSVRHLILAILETAVRPLRIRQQLYCAYD